MQCQILLFVVHMTMFCTSGTLNYLWISLIVCLFVFVIIVFVLFMFLFLLRGPGDLTVEGSVDVDVDVYFKIIHFLILSLL